MKIRSFIQILVLVGLFLTGCISKDNSMVKLDSTSQPSTFQNEETGYPVEPSETDFESGYPLMDSKDDLLQEPIFSINEPVVGGDTTVAGTGPAGVPILLVDVSRVGLILGETTISQDGNFSFTFEAPLESGNSVGLQLGDLTGTDLDENDFVNSQTYYVRPLIGILFDMVTVK